MSDDLLADFEAGCTRRQYLLLRALESGADFFAAQEAVSSVAIEHPEWDMAEVRSLAEWEEVTGGSDKVGT